MQNKIDLGCIVKATAGRDNGGLFIVVKVVDSMYVHICNGDNRSLEKPKLKKIKHLQFIERNDNIAEKLNNKTIVFDSEIFSALKKCSQK